MHRILATPELQLSTTKREKVDTECFYYEIMVRKPIEMFYDKRKKAFHK